MLNIGLQRGIITYYEMYILLQWNMSEVLQL
jgi:hypothetical protein